MDKMQVIKVKFNGGMCRITAAKAVNEDVISFSALEERLRSSFKLPVTATVSLTYTDADGDVINLSSDQDIVDALLYQQLNPLRVELTVEETAEPANVAVSALPAAVKPAADVALASRAAEIPAPAAKTPAALTAVTVAASAATPTPTPTPTSTAAGKPAPAAKAPAPEKTFKAASVPASAAAEAKSSASPAGASGKCEKAVEEFSALVESQLREVLGMSGEVGRRAKEFEPLLREAPLKIAQVLDAALRSGLSVSFEPVLETPAGSVRAADPVEKEPSLSREGSALSSASFAKQAPPAPQECRSAAQGENCPAEQGKAKASEKVTANAFAADSAASGTLKATGLGELLGATAATVEAAVAAGAQAASAAAAAEAAMGKAAEASEVAKHAGAAKAEADGAPAPVVHKGIICDGCDMGPLVGLRYKSLVKHDYDLCESCFRRGGAPAEHYKCIQQPVFRVTRHGGHPGPHFRGASWTSPTQHGGRPLRCGPPGPPGFLGRPAGPVCSFPHAPQVMKLEARFVADVTIPDNMEMLPGTRFTKIWRMRNDGPFPWPQYTQVVHIGGDALGERNSTILEIPLGGVPPKAEVDVPVDMVAPAKLGRYMSHWRLCAPGGPKFGHRVWCLIQVVAPESVPLMKPPVVAPPVVAALPRPSAPPLEPATVPAAPAKAPARSAPAAPAATEEERVDPLIALVAAAVPPGPVIEEAEGENTAAAAPAEATAIVEEPAPAIAAPAAAAESEAVARAAGAAAEGFVEVAVPASAPAAAAAAAAPGLPLVAAAVESSAVGTFSLVEAAEKQMDDASDSSAGLSDTASMDGFVDAGAAAGASSAPNGKALSTASARTAPKPAAPAAPAAPTPEALAAAAREQMFLVEDEGESEALDQLEGMGFEDRELNRAVLRKADGNLFAAIETLMSVAEWDTMLADLEEMGFDDKMLNKRIMFKNDGSVKGTVRELVHLYRAKGGQ